MRYGQEEIRGLLIYTQVYLHKMIIIYSSQHCHPQWMPYVIQDGTIVFDIYGMIIKQKNITITKKFEANLLSGLVGNLRNPQACVTVGWTDGHAELRMDKALPMPLSKSGLDWAEAGTNTLSQRMTWERCAPLACWVQTIQCPCNKKCMLRLPFIYAGVARRGYVSSPWTVFVRLGWQDLYYFGL